MDVKGKSAALYGRFSPGVRETLVSEIAKRGGSVARDLMRRSDVFVVGARATPLIDGGHLASRLATARRRKIPVFAERRFVEALRGDEEPAGSLPLSAAQSGLSREGIEVLAAFDVVRIDDERCRFGDAAALKTAADLLKGGSSLTETVRTLTKTRDYSPRGRRKVVLDRRGEAALQWEFGLTTLEGQGFLPLDEGAATIEDLFEAAAAAEASGVSDEAARLYEIAGRADKKDPIACFNLGNIQLASEAYGEAALSFRRAIARDPGFVEARYNLAQVYDALGKLDLARAELIAALEHEPDYADARFNLAHVEFKRGALAEAKTHFERYLASDPPADWAQKARRAIQYCASQLSA